LGSPKQLGEILFDELKLPGGSKTKTGAWSTDASILEDLAEQHDLPAKVLEWRQLSKLRSTYTEALQAAVNPETAPRPHFLRARRHHHRPPVVERSEPAEHPGPHRGRPQDPPRLRRRARQCARQRRLFADRIAPSRPYRRYSAIEAGFRRRLDIHAMTASEMFGVPLEGHARRNPRVAPRPSISASSTASPPSASPTSSASRAKRRALTSKNISNASPASAITWRNQEASRRANGYVKTIFGRKCIYPASQRRTRPNAPSTSAPPSTRRFKAAADIIRRAMVRLPKAALWRKRSSSRACCCRCTTNSCSKRRRNEAETLCKLAKDRDGSGAGAGRHSQCAADGRSESGRDMGRGALNVKTRSAGGPNVTFSP
jgi:DNA polymerase-1